MADNNTRIVPAEANEQTQISPESGLNRLTGRVIDNGRKAVSAAAFVVLSTVPGSAYAADTPNTPSTSANASADKRGGQVVTLKDGSKVNMEDLWKREQGGEKKIGDSIKDDGEFDAYVEYKKGVQLTALNQTKDQRGEVKEALNQEKKGLESEKTALNQLNALYVLIDGLFIEQGTKPNDKYPSQARIVQSVLSNPILTQKFTPDTINLLKDMEKSLSEGKNPFAYMSPSGKAKLKALLKA